MLSGVLNSEVAIKVNIQIMRVFTRMREMLETHKDILKKLENLERKGIAARHTLLCGLFSEYDNRPADQRSEGLTPYCSSLCLKPVGSMCTIISNTFSISFRMLFSTATQILWEASVDIAPSTSISRTIIR